MWLNNCFKLDGPFKVSRLGTPMYKLCKYVNRDPFIALSRILKGKWDILEWSICFLFTTPRQNKLLWVFFVMKNEKNNQEQRLCKFLQKAF